MSDKLITDLGSGSISDDSLILIGDPSTGNLKNTGYKAAKDYFQQGIVVDTGSLLSSASFQAYTSSNDASLANVYASESNYVPSASYNPYTSSTATIINNVYASESNYTLTSSFIPVSSSLYDVSSSNVVTSASLLTKVNNTFLSESNYTTLSQFNTYTGSLTIGGGTISGSGTSQSLAIFNGTTSISTSGLFVTTPRGQYTGSFLGINTSNPTGALHIVTSGSDIWLQNITLATSSTNNAPAPSIYFDGQSANLANSTSVTTRLRFSQYFTPVAATVVTQGFSFKSAINTNTETPLAYIDSKGLIASVQSAGNNGLTGLYVGNNLFDPNNAKGTSYVWLTATNSGTGQIDLATAASYFLVITISAGEAARFDGSRRFGIGVNSPTAWTHLRAANGAGFASLKINSGILLSSPESGSVEYDGTNLYISNQSGSLNSSSRFIVDSEIYGIPLVATGSGGGWSAGSPMTSSIFGRNHAGILTITTGGGGPSASATLCTVSYTSGSYPSGSAISLTPGNANSSALSGSQKIWASGSNYSFVLTSGATPLIASTTYVWNYRVSGF